MRPVRGPELTRIGRTLDAWRTELLALLDPDRPCGGEQRPERSDQRADQKVKRGGHGFRSLAD